MPLSFTLDQAIGRFKIQLAEIGPEAFAEYPGGFQQYLLENQNKISGGFINPGRTQDQKMVMYGDDKKAYDVDLADFDDIFMMPDGDYYNFTLFISQHYSETTSVEIGAAIPDLDPKIVPPSLVDNISQLMSVDASVVSVDPVKAEEVLKGRKIHELITSGETQQDRINKFFEMYYDLKIIDPPDELYKMDEDEDGYADTWSEDFNQGLYAEQGIAVGATGGSITWRDQDAVGTENVGKTLETLYKDVRQYFLPGSYIPQNLDPRPTYENRSKGYLKIRNLNHAVVIRNESGANIGLTTETPSNVSGDWANYPRWQVDGFTITMWVRFLNVKSGGTLFNFGNPLRQAGPRGFMLDTFVRDERRYLRLVVRDWEEKIRDSHVGVPDTARVDTTDEAVNYTVDFLNYNYLEVPSDMKEWYFIVATYNPSIDEDASILTEQGYDTCYYDGTSYICHKDPDFWRWNIDEEGYTSNSGLGAQCKVEIISRTDLLRARGFQT